MRFIIYGAGGIGGTIGARLHIAGYPVQLIARGEHAEVMRTKGLHFIAPGIDETLQIPTCTHPDQIEWINDDLVLLCMKSQHTAAALDDLRAAGVRDQAIVCAQNGVANEAMALRRFENVYGMLVFLPALFLVPGEVVTNATDVGGVLDTGLYTGGVDNTVSELTEALTKAGFGATPDKKVMRKKYGKLLSNVNNSLSALTNMAEGSKEISRMLNEEALACYEAAGIDCASVDEMKALYSTMQSVKMEQFSRPGGSSWQSAMRGTGNIEVDYLNGEIAQLGRRYGVPTPANTVCQEFAWRLSHEKGKPGSVAVDTLLQAMK